MLVYLMVTHKPFRLFSLFFIHFFFLLLRPSNFICSIFKFLILFSALSNLLFNPSSECFISDTVIFSSRISVWSLFIISVSLLTFSFCSYIVFLMSFSYLSTFSFSFLNIFKTVDLKFLSGLSQRWFLSMYFCPSE